MKTIIFSLVLCVPLWGAAQAVDNEAIRQVDSLIRVSRDFTARASYIQALEVNAAAEKLALETSGRESAAYGSCCFNRGRILWNREDYPEAEKWYLESLTIRGKVLGKEHPDYAHSLNNLGLLYMNMGKTEKAEPLYL